MDKVELDKIVRQAIVKFPDAKDSINQMADKIVESGNTKAMELYAEELQRQITSKDINVLKHIKREHKQFDQWSNALSEGFGFKFWSYILPRLLGLALIVTVLAYVF